MKTLVHFDELDALPVGTVIMADAWGDVALKKKVHRWKGATPPTADQIRQRDPEKFDVEVFWAVAGSTGPLVSCSGPFTVLHMPGGSPDA